MLYRNDSAQLEPPPEGMDDPERTCGECAFMREVMGVGRRSHVCVYDLWRAKTLDEVRDADVCLVDLRDGACRDFERWEA